MKTEELKEKYEEYKKEFELPEFDELDVEFTIKDIDNDNILLVEIREKILDKFDEYVKILEGIVQPDTTLINMYESRVFDDEEKGRIFTLFKRFMYLERFSIQTDMEDGDMKLAEFINVAYKEWLKLKPSLLDIIIKLKDSWEMDEDSKFIAEYCG